MGVFIWEVENGRDEDVEVSIMFSLQNGTGAKEDGSGGHWNEPFTFQKDGERVAGVLLHHCPAVNPFTLAISAREKVKGWPWCCGCCWGGCAALLDVGDLLAAAGKGWVCNGFGVGTSSQCFPDPKSGEITSLRVPSLGVSIRRAAEGEACGGYKFGVRVAGQHMGSECDVLVVVLGSGEH